LRNDQRDRYPPFEAKEDTEIPLEIREKLDWSLDMLIRDPSHPSLRNKKISGTDNFWEFSITMNYRGVYRQEKDKAFLVAVGKHEDIFYWNKSRHLRINSI